MALALTLAAATLVALLVAAGLARARAAARRRALADELVAWAAHSAVGRGRLESSGNVAVDLGDRGQVRIRTQALERVIAATGAVDSDTARRRLFESSVAFMASGPKPLPGKLSLKVHGPRLLPRLIQPALLAMLPEEAPAAARRLPELGLAAVYVVPGDGGPRYVTEDQIAELGIDAEALHCVALAVLRQRLEETPLRRAIATAAAESLSPSDGCGASRVLVLGELLERGQTVTAWLRSPAELRLGGSPGDRGDSARPVETLLDGPVRVTAEGLRVERGS